MRYIIIIVSARYLFAHTGTSCVYRDKGAPSASIGSEKIKFDYDERAGTTRKYYKFDLEPEVEVNNGDIIGSPDVWFRLNVIIFVRCKCHGDVVNMKHIIWVKYVRIRFSGVLFT